MRLTQSGRGASCSTHSNPYFSPACVTRLRSSWLFGAASVMAACATGPSSTREGQVGTMDGAQVRFTAAVTECQRQHTYTVSEAVRENEPSTGAARTLTACLERARTTLELETGQAHR